jgi:hypothetical protein
VIDAVPLATGIKRINYPSALRRFTPRLWSPVTRRRARTAVAFDLEVSGPRLDIMVHISLDLTHLIPVPLRIQYINATSVDQKIAQSYDTTSESDIFTLHGLAAVLGEQGQTRPSKHGALIAKPLSGERR